MADEEFEDESEDNPEDSEVIRALRRQAREGKAAAAERDKLARELAFTRAGVPETKQSAYFVKAYDGELDPTAIRDAAIEAGFLEKDETNDKSSQEDQAAYERMQSAVEGSSDSEPPGYADELAGAKSEDEVLAVLEKFGKKIVNPR